jgi:hypothetical protein
LNVGDYERTGEFTGDFKRFIDCCRVDTGCDFTQRAEIALLLPRETVRVDLRGLKSVEVRLNCAVGSSFISRSLFSFALSIRMPYCKSVRCRLFGVFNCLLLCA